MCAHNSLRAATAASTAVSQRMRLVIGASMVPDYRKRKTAFPDGEDAFFVAGGRAFGVADGIGAWSQRNIDAGKYSRELMIRAGAYFDTDATRIDPVEAMVYAEEYAKVHQGSCTFCTLVLDGSNLRSAVLGDSGYVVLRRDIIEKDVNGKALPRPSKTCMDNNCLLHLRTGGGGWKVVYKSQEQQHAFNTPYQIGQGVTGISSRNAVSLLLPVRQGDIVVCGTDGLFDNLFLNDICQLVGKHLEGTHGIAACNAHNKNQEQQAHVQELAEHITHAAVAASMHPGRRSPFSAQCVKAGFEAHGGKGDDITTVVAVVACEQPSTLEKSS